MTSRHKEASVHVIIPNYMAITDCNQPLLMAPSLHSKVVNATEGALQPLFQICQRCNLITVAVSASINALKLGGIAKNS